MKKNILNKIELILLIAFFISAILLTIGSQINYKVHLSLVPVVGDEKMPLRYTMQKEALLYEKEDTYYLRWEMSEAGRWLRTESTVKANKIEWNPTTNDYGKLRKDYAILQEQPAIITDVFYDEQETKKVLVTAVLDPNAFEDWASTDSYMVDLSFMSPAYSHVIPKSCTQKDDVDKSFVYVVKEIPKIWGTEYVLRKEYVKIIADNGSHVALEMPPTARVVVDANYSTIRGYHDGLIVGINEAE
jgi:hypothetical protein